MTSPINDQPPPIPNTNCSIWALVIEDMKERDRIGRERYGVPLQAHNGRDSLVDAYQEALDLSVYLRQAIEERKRPTIVCLCGSTRFADAYRDANKSETLAGRIVLSVGMFGHQEGLDMNGPVKAMLDELHLAKIDLADEILVLNVGGYIGDSTRREIAYAEGTGKRIRYLETVGATTRD